ncbi:CPBP family intramembrane metalloprotease [Bacillus sp. FJAT-49732]|uniref:CPBP family intramembrane metalloprotease n=1 Tax=Lederbergia citrisecunda TaxID=2833583 RepID=A0A942YL74_9BACI|nr:CPBP family intramembrane glutamic endopeptidase [Lederbergia citrisecunda]MBS4201168.1 CPBP family intramembrane metalloprotease [Lederbergia citrisecunda]
MLYKFVCLLLLWGMIVFTVMQGNELVWGISACISILSMHFISKWLKIGGFSKIGLPFNRGWFGYLMSGCLIGIIFQVIRFLLMYSTGAYEIRFISQDWGSLIISTMILLVSTAYVGFAEEIVFRGYVINMLPSYRSKLTVIISSLLFTLAHMIDGNFELSRISFLFLMGLFFAICYVLTRSIWFVAGIHWFWDFTWFYLGADGGSSSSKIVDVTINPHMHSYYEWFDVLLVICLLLLLALVQKTAIMKRSGIPM